MLVFSLIFIRIALFFFLKKKKKKELKQIIEKKGVMEKFCKTRRPFFKITIYLKNNIFFKILK
jgi:hypothetical protein